MKHSFHKYTSLFAVLAAVGLTGTATLVRAAPQDLVAGRDSDVARAELQSTPQPLPELPKSVSKWSGSAATRFDAKRKMAMGSQPATTYGRQGGDPTLPELQDRPQPLPWSS